MKALVAKIPGEVSSETEDLISFFAEHPADRKSDPRGRSGYNCCLLHIFLSLALKAFFKFFLVRIRRNPTQARSR
jgi:hypothetical protein